MAKRPAKSGLDEDENLDEAVLRRFVFQTFGRARRTQDSSVMPDVWLRYIRVAERIARRRPVERPVDLLLTPWSGTRAGEIAHQLRTRLQSSKTGQVGHARIAMSDSRVVVCAGFHRLVRDVVPLTGWWRDLFRNQMKKKIDEFGIEKKREPSDAEKLQFLEHFFEEKFNRIKQKRKPGGADFELARFAALVGFIDRLMAAKTRSAIADLAALAHRLGPVTLDGEIEPEELDDRQDLNETEWRLLRDLYNRAQRLLWPDTHIEPKDSKTVFVVSLNRRARQTLFDSRATVKADAAQRLFQINTAGVCFAVIDGGIDATHPAFLDLSTEEASNLRDQSDPPEADCLRNSRVRATYDFTILRDIVAYADILRDPNQHKNLPNDVPNREVLIGLAKANSTLCDHLSIRSDNARDIDWEIVRPLIEISHRKPPPADEGPPKGRGKVKSRSKGKAWDRDAYRLPGTDHGTHVAGILAANFPKDPETGKDLTGMCPHLSLYDLRVFDQEGHGDEFAILCAIEFVGWLNRDRANPVVHGVNLSLALAHDVDSFACGQTPICEACNLLVGTGTLVVAAAGNTGFEGGGGAKQQSLGTGYRPISITDPGNADNVITVGSTHRRDPHLYGVSFFSARGPTGDGRRKPDVLAPGEKITSTIPRRTGSSKRMDGTSMAAPHVAGRKDIRLAAAAMLMGRHPELIGHPLRIKEILMKTATDLGREPNFQGAGLVDVLRALQSV
jgi:serine protease AprX